MNHLRRYKLIGKLRLFVGSIPITSILGVFANWERVGNTGSIPVAAID